MTNGTEKNSAPKKRGRPRKPLGVSEECRVRDKVLQNASQSDGVLGRGDLGNSELYDVDERILERGSQELFKMNKFFQFMRAHYIRVCSICALITAILLSVLIPNFLWAIDRDLPYVITDFKMGSGYPGQMVPLTAIIEEKSIGRICGVLANPQTIDATGELGYVSTTRLISGDAVQMMHKTQDGKVKFKTSVQMPINLKPGVGDLIVDIAMNCRDNDTHSERPILSVVKGYVTVIEKPEGAPVLACNKGIK